MIDLLLFVKEICPRRTLSFSPCSRVFNRGTGRERHHRLGPHQSRGEPAAADEVFLLGPDGECRRRRARRPIHTGVYPQCHILTNRTWCACFTRASAMISRLTGQALSIQVFDAATHVQGITGTIESYVPEPSETCFTFRHGRDQEHPARL